MIWPWRRQGAAILIDLKVIPNAKVDVREGVAPDADGRPRLQLRIKAPPVDGKANAAVLKLLAERLGGTRSGNRARWVAVCPIYGTSLGVG